MTRADPLGKRALFSAAVRRPGTVLVECSACGATSRLSYVDLARAHLPLWGWIPSRRHAHFLRCPACERRTWTSVGWFG